MQREKNGPNVLYLGYSGFPYGYAELQKILLISKAILHAGGKVTILGKRGFHNQNSHPELKTVGHVEKIKYVYSSGTPFRQNNFFKRNFSKLIERRLELRTIRKLHNKEKFDVAIISSARFMDVVQYRQISRALDFKILLNFVEYRSAISKWYELNYKINDILFDRYAVKLSDGVLVISEFLIKIIKNIDPHKPYLKIPMMVDTERFYGIARTTVEKYFLFCGAAFYREIIFFNISAFELLENSETYLYLVVNGSTEHIGEIKVRVTSSPKADLIKIYSGVTDDELSALYKNAIGLLIPLRPSIQDMARFPHKIGEYLSSGNPVVTTNYGEVKYYFKDKENALVAMEYNVDAFSDKMNFILSHPSESKLIGEKGKDLALEKADYRGYGQKLSDFFLKIK